MTTTKTSSSDSFVQGYNYGAFNKIELTPREIATQFSDVESDSFREGNIDGIVGDRFRLDLTLGQRRFIFVK